MYIEILCNISHSVRHTVTVMTSELQYQPQRQYLHYRWPWLTAVLGVLLKIARNSTQTIFLLNLNSEIIFNYMYIRERKTFAGYTQIISYHSLLIRHNKNDASFLNALYFYLKICVFLCRSPNMAMRFLVTRTCVLFLMSRQGKGMTLK